MDSDAQISEVEGRRHLHSLISASTFSDIKNLTLKYGSIAKGKLETIYLFFVNATTIRLPMI